MNRIFFITIGMCIIAGPVQADDCRNNDGSSRNGSLTDTSVLPVCDDNIVTAKTTVRQQYIDGSAQGKIKDIRAIPGVDSLAAKQRVAK